MSTFWEDWQAKCQARYDEEVARGEHDKLCEIPERPWICHCSKRRRIEQGFTELPGELIWNEPSCPKCWSDVWHDGDSWRCPKCPVSWDSSGTTADWTDDYGDLTPGTPKAPAVVTVEATGGVL